MRLRLVSETVRWHHTRCLLPGIDATVDQLEGLDRISEIAYQSAIRPFLDGAPAVLHEEKEVKSNKRSAGELLLQFATTRLVLIFVGLDSRGATRRGEERQRAQGRPISARESIDRVLLATLLMDLLLRGQIEQTKRSNIK